MGRVAMDDKKEEETPSHLDFSIFRSIDIATDGDISCASPASPGDEGTEGRQASLPSEGCVMAVGDNCMTSSEADT